MYRASQLVLAAVVTLIGCADSGPAAPNDARVAVSQAPSLAKSSGAVENYTVPVSFVIPGGTCGLTTTVTGSGLFHIVTRSTQSGDGAWHVSFSWDAHGTATGADGSSYRFNYAINAKSVDPTGANDVAIIELVDHFNLQGQGNTPDLRVYLHGTFENPSFNPVGDVVIRGPGIFCDPI